MKEGMLFVPIFGEIKRKVALKCKRSLQRLSQTRRINDNGPDVKLYSENEELKE